MGLGIQSLRLQNTSLPRQWEKFRPHKVLCLVPCGPVERNTTWYVRCKRSLKAYPLNTLRKLPNLEMPQKNLRTLAKTTGSPKLVGSVTRLISSTLLPFAVLGVSLLRP